MLDYAVVEELLEFNPVTLIPKGAVGTIENRERDLSDQEAREMLETVDASSMGRPIKIAVRRPRPDLPGAGQLSKVQTQLSFPSAHAATSLCGARMLRDAGAPGAPLYALAGALSLSRLYLGVHYPSDEVAGALLGDEIGRGASR